MNNIDTSDLGEVDKVNRLLELIKTFRQLRKEKNKHGVTTVTENGSQTFTKTNPAIEKMNQTSSKILELERNIKWLLPVDEVVEDETEEVIVEELISDSLDDGELV